jgi:hypothetical protein
VTIENKSMVSLHGLKPGKQAIIQVDQDGTPLEQHWRRRLKDSISDGCIAVIEAAVEVEVETKQSKASKKEAE